MAAIVFGSEEAKAIVESDKAMQRLLDSGPTRIDEINREIDALEEEIELLRDEATSLQYRVERLEDEKDEIEKALNK